MGFIMPEIIITPDVFDDLPSVIRRRCVESHPGFKAWCDDYAEAKMGNATPVSSSAKPPIGYAEQKRIAGKKRQFYSADDMPCEHRGPVIRQDESNLCGSKGKEIDIYSCSLHKECSLGRYCKKQTVQTCFACQDRATASSEEPASPASS